MAESYPRPPITETVIEFRLKTHASQSTVEKARKAIGKSYARSEELKELKLQFDTTTERTSVDSAFAGTRLYSADGADIVWVKPNGISISRLAPYCGWEKFREHARGAWEKWREIVGARQLDRIGLRYINRIDIPVSEKTGAVRIEDYLRLTPSYPDPDQRFYMFAIQTQIAVDPYRMTVNTGSAPSTLIDHLSYLLDLDLFQEGELPLKDEDVWAIADDMRLKKNEVFESYITDLTRSLFR